jgi:hypothetical protein
MSTPDPEVDPVEEIEPVEPVAAEDVSTPDPEVDAVEQPVEPVAADGGEEAPTAI